ncbi:MAG: hypothetical protein J5I93_20110 [Pirellulaceae bacterium]|nr:hypothetical protein [Pirellulaceae bacterium]
MSELPTFDQFAGSIEDTFQLLDATDTALPAQLIEVKPLGISAADNRQAFSLVFRTRDSRILPQRLYQLEHPRLGCHALFLVPLGPDGQGMRYEAIFN